MGRVPRPVRALPHARRHAVHHRRRRGALEERSNARQGRARHHRETGPDVHQGWTDDERPPGRPTAGGAGRARGAPGRGQALRDRRRDCHHREGTRRPPRTILRRDLGEAGGGGVARTGVPRASRRHRHLRRGQGAEAGDPQHREQGPVRAAQGGGGVPGSHRAIRPAAEDRLRRAAQRVGRGLLHRARLPQRGVQPAETAGPRVGPGEGERCVRAAGVPRAVHASRVGERMDRRREAQRLPQGGDPRAHRRRTGVLPRAAAPGWVLSQRSAPGQPDEDGGPDRPEQERARDSRFRPDGFDPAGGHGHHGLVHHPPREQGLPRAGGRFHRPQDPTRRLRQGQGHPAHGQGSVSVRKGRRRQKVRSRAEEDVQHGGRLAAVHRGRIPGDDPGPSHRPERHPVLDPALLRPPRQGGGDARGHRAHRQPRLPSGDGGVPFRRA
mmetsp:Transcript_10006/g.41216  ORF Transcript_10006/g.41216 Transcript_10006/m.41216 type:complete len:440 (+) Transcript_10006:418-1737(+)